MYFTTLVTVECRRGTYSSGRLSILTAIPIDKTANPDDGVKVTLDKQACFFVRLVAFWHIQ